MFTRHALLGRWIVGFAAALIVSGPLVGCASSDRSAASEPAVSHALLVEPGQRVTALEAAVTTLRNAGYAVDRADYRLGVITTRPEPVVTALEPWHAADQLQGDAWAATTGQLQRVVRVDFAESAEPDEAADNPEAPRSLRVRVQLERFEVPTRRVINAAKGRVFSSLSDVPAPWAQRGIDRRYWRPIGRDTAEEQRLQRALSQAFSADPL
ncbi:MAG: hypothetical protein AAGF84_09600 [Planctomycetota bacterium]